jgi:hypothetical protein
MGTTAEPIVNGHQTETSLTDAQKATIRHELQSILDSRPFRNSARSKQFLSYVVEHKLEGREESLKERTIGTEIFQRKAGYATGDDPVVRVQAGEVRRRLEQYHHSQTIASPVRIELPLGSYSPEFHWDVIAAPVVEKPAAVPRRRWLAWTIGAVCFALALAGVLVFRSPFSHRASDSALDQFWAPIFTSSQPVLICLAKPVFYRPSLELYRRYSKTHAGTYQTEVERFDRPLPLDPKEKITWGDMQLFSDYGVAMGDVYVAARLSALFDHINKPSQVRIGTNYSFEDLRNSPAVVVGAFNNRWTLQMTSNLRFAFVEQDGHFEIQERSPSGGARSWVLGPEGQIVEDFAVVTRLLDSKTGQVVIAAAGLGANGTQAAGEFISRQDYLEEAFRSAPSDWPRKNVQVVVETTVTDSVAGPPRVIATYFW